MCKRSNYPKYLQKRGREHPAIEWSPLSVVVTGKHCPQLLPTQAHLHSGPLGRVCSDTCCLSPPLLIRSPSRTAPPRLLLKTLSSKSDPHPSLLSDSIKVPATYHNCPPKAEAEAPPPLLLPIRGSGRDSRRSCSGCGKS